MVKFHVFAAVAFLVALLTACSSSYVAHTPVTIAHYSNRITLSREHPTDARLGIGLVSISANGNTAIRILDSGRIIRASPGGYFVGPEFGREGLQLVSASRGTHTVVLEHTWAE
jgi:hypothetical protein